MLPLLQTHEIHESILEFLKLCFTKPHNHQRLHSQLLGTAHGVIIFCQKCRAQQAPALLVSLRMRKGGGRQACLVCQQRLVRVRYCP